MVARIPQDTTETRGLVMAHNGAICEGCARWAAVSGAVRGWLLREMDNSPLGAVVTHHLLGTMRASTEALSLQSPKLRPFTRWALDDGVWLEAMKAGILPLEDSTEPPPGGSLDDMAEAVAAGSQAGMEERDCVVLRRAAAILMKRAHEKAKAYRGPWRRGPDKVPLRPPKGLT